MESEYIILNSVTFSLNCILFLAGAIAGILALVRKKTFPGILALAAFVLLGLNDLTGILLPLVMTPLIDQFGLDYNTYILTNLCSTAPLHFLGILALVILAFLNVRKKQEKNDPEQPETPPVP